MPNLGTHTPLLRHLQTNLKPFPKQRLCMVRLWQPHRARQPLKELQLRLLKSSKQSQKAVPQTAQLLGCLQQHSLMRAQQSHPSGQKQPRTGRQQALLLCRCLISYLQAPSRRILPIPRGIRTGWRARTGVRRAAAQRLKRLSSPMGCQSTSPLTSNRCSKSTKLGCSRTILTSLKRRLVGLMHHMAPMKVAQQRQLSPAVYGMPGRMMQRVSTQCLVGRVIKHQALSSTAVMPRRVKTRAWPGRDPRQLAMVARMAAMLSSRAQHSLTCSSRLARHSCH